MGQSLKVKLLVPIIILAILGMLISTVISYILSTNAMEAAVRAQLVQITKSIENNVKFWVRDRSIDVASWAEKVVFQKALEDSFVGKAARKSAKLQLEKIKENKIREYIK